MWVTGVQTCALPICSVVIFRLVCTVYFYFNMGNLFSKCCENKLTPERPVCCWILSKYCPHRLVVYFCQSDGVTFLFLLPGFSMPWRHNLSHASNSPSTPIREGRWGTVEPLEGQRMPGYSGMSAFRNFTSIKGGDSYWHIFQCCYNFLTFYAEL